jgi:hypothetical protein
MLARFESCDGDRGMAISGSMSQTVLSTGTAGAGQNSLGIVVYATTCAFPINPAPIMPTFIFFMA